MHPFMHWRFLGEGQNRTRPSVRRHAYSSVNVESRNKRRHFVAGTRLFYMWAAQCPASVLRFLFDHVTPRMYRQACGEIRRQPKLHGDFSNESRITTLATAHMYRFGCACVFMVLAVCHFYILLTLECLLAVCSV